MATYDPFAAQQAVNRAITQAVGFPSMYGSQNIITAGVSNAPQAGIANSLPFFRTAPTGGVSGGGSRPVSPATQGGYTMTSRPAAVAPSSSSSAGGNAALSASVAALPDNAPNMDEIANLLKGIMGQYSKDAAFTDAQAITNRQAQIERERQMPAIQRAVEGAGTSASSMQALLSQKLATDIATNAAAAGAEQARAYGGIQSQLGGTLAQMAASGDPRAKLLASLMQTQMDTASRESIAQLGTNAELYKADLDSWTKMNAPRPGAGAIINNSGDSEILNAIKALGMQPRSSSNISSGPSGFPYGDVSASSTRPGGNTTSRY